MGNVFDEQTGEEPPTEYRDLEELIDFAVFDFANYREGEGTLLTPQLEALGYTQIQFQMGEHDSFGPLTRTCRTINRWGQVVWFIYG